ncbi:hypothetical protein ACFXHA_43160 [Nocardia sp. NPDC059240]|uniref:hypothetical protein n=1 Tax=Nocardia sp. NPDC059240 TaxID=3346786 RepID=UPI0036913C9C
MTTADEEFQALGWDPHTFEVLGRVMHVLFNTPGPLSECLGFRLWPTLPGGGYVLCWRGVAPTEEEIVEYLLEAAADDVQTTVLRPGDVRRFRKGPYYTEVDVSGVIFQLRPEPMPQPHTYAAMGEYWRTGALTRP